MSSAPSIKTPTEQTHAYAALDLGTNSCRMLIARPNNNNFRIIDSFSKSVNLGSGLEAVSYTHLTLPTKRIV